MTTLADDIIRDAFRPKTIMPRFTNRSMVDLRMTMAKAKRFVADDSMSEFMAKLASVPFDAVKPERRPETMDVLRHGARLPHPITWVEYMEVPFRKGLMEATPGAKDPWGKSLVTDGLPERLGWLLEQHPKIETAVRMTEFVSGKPEGLPPFIAPWNYVWNTVDEPLPWSNVENNPAEIGHGLTGFRSPYMGVIFDKPIPKEHSLSVQHAEGLEYTTHRMLGEFAGGLRYALAFLATLNDVPVTMADVRPHRGFFARGQYRKFMEHRVISLKIPQRTSTTRLARRVIALTRRKRHEVRGHWRLYQRGGSLCLPSFHAWAAADAEGHAPCKNCSAWRTWIAEHGRGDASLGYVSHDYAVTHPKQ